MARSAISSRIKSLFAKDRMEARFATELPSGRFVYASKAFQVLTGYSRKDVRELTLWQILGPGERDRFCEGLTEEKAGKEDDNVYALVKKNGEIIKGELSGTLEFLDGTRVLLCSLRDVTERERIEEQRHYEKRIQAMGTLASGIAHEFNNILAAIQGYAQLLGMALGEENPLSAYVKEIEESCQRAAGLTGKMVLLSRLHEGKRIPLRLNEVVEDFAQQLRQSLPEGVSVETDFSASDPVILADPIQMEQLLGNLAKNSQDAVGDTGTIRFVTSALQLDEAFRKTYPWARPGKYAQIEVVDTGEGIPHHLLPRIFEPFFTTKDPGKGSGLGLSIAYSIVKAHGGYILAESPISRGRGTAFRVLLPLWEEMEEPPRVKEPPSPGLDSGKRVGNRILVVDDEPQIRDILHTALSKKGYRVTLASNGNEGLEAYREASLKGQPVDLVILDLAMPVLSGELCLEALLKLDPRVRVIVVTGKSPYPQQMQALKSKVRRILPKPFRLGELLEAVREQLGEWEGESPS